MASRYQTWHICRSKLFRKDTGEPGEPDARKSRTSGSGGRGWYSWATKTRPLTLHKAARALVNRFGLLVFEDLKIVNMSAAPDPKPDPDKEGSYLPNGASAKAGLNQSILDAGWGQFQQMCVVKAESAGRRVLCVDPRMTSQLCSGCGQVVHKELEERWHSCPCGCELDRDHNAALNILFRGQEVAHKGTPL